MERFEIEDIVTQDIYGVVFRARVKSSGTPVSIHRFFPFGREGHGLEEGEGVSFRNTVSRLGQVKHPALRTSIEGSVDRIDGMPYLVSEWTAGSSLREALNGERLDPSLVVEVMRLALELSFVLSEVLGQEALWVATDLDSIFVGETESGPTFTFSPSPFQLLASETKSCDLFPLVSLGEELAGWQNTLVSAGAGNGLGGWFKWLKENPETGIRQALESLTTTVGGEPVTQQVETPNVEPAPPTVKLKKSSSKAPYLIVGVLSLLVLTAFSGYLFINKESSVSGEVSVPPRAPKIIDVTESSLEASTEPVPSSSEAPRIAPQSQSEFLKLSSHQIGLMRQLKRGTPIEVTGKLKVATLNKRNALIILKFEKGNGTSPILGVIPQKDYQGEFSVAAFKPYYGKAIRVRGTSNPDRTKKCRDVLVKRFEDIVLVTGE